MIGSNRKAVLVLGMHRSGTSAVTRVLNLLGLDLPTRLLPPKPDNRLGFWESMELQQLHDEALASCGSWWGDWRSIPQEWFGSDDCRRFGDRVTKILERDFANSNVFVIKDPRICRIVPLWLQALARLDIEPLAVIVVRDPGEVAASLALRNEFDTSTSKLVWLRHMLDVERYTRSITRSVVTFEGLVSNWRFTMSKMGEDLRIEWPVSPGTAAASIGEFLSPTERHHSAHAGGALPAWVTAAYEELLRESQGETKRRHPRRWERLGGELDRATAVFGGLLANKDRDDEAAALRAELQSAGQWITTLSAELTIVTENARSLKLRLDAARSEMFGLREAWAVKAARLAELERKIKSSRFLFKAAWKKVVRFPGDLQSRVRKSRSDARAKRGAKAALRKIANSGLFDKEWYLEHNPDIAASGMAPIKHYLACGAKEGRNPSESFSTNDYLLENPDVAAANANPLLHFVRYGAAEGRPSGSLSNTIVKNRRRSPLGSSCPSPANSDAAWIWSALAKRRLKKSQRRAVRSIAHSGLFDKGWYLERYPDIAASGMDPIEHYVAFGAKEGRNPSESFSTNDYLLENPDVAAANANPLLHFVRYGAAEGRPSGSLSNTIVKNRRRIPLGSSCPSPVNSDAAWIWSVLAKRRLKKSQKRAIRRIAHSGLFDRGWYLENNPDVAVSGMDPIEHYVVFGAKEGRDPSKSFRTSEYLLENPDVAGANVNPLLHFVLYGAAEGRRSRVPQSKDFSNKVARGSVPCFLQITKAAIPTALANAQQWCTSKDPEVSILIINWNAAQLTLECVRHIWANTKDVTYEIIIADNGSDPNDTVLLKNLGSGTRLLELGTNRFFGEANNIAAEQAKGRYLCLLNNDAFVQAGWLRLLVDELKNNPEAGAAGPMFIFPDNTLQEAGGAVDAKGYPTRFGRNLDPTMSEFNLPRFVDYISAATLLIERELFLDAGGFELAYEPAYYEDTDLCFKLRALGRKTRYCPTAKIIHIEGWSANDDSVAEERRKILGDLNRDKFVKRWSPYLQTRSEDDLPQIQKCIHASNGRGADGSLLVSKTRPNSETAAIYTPFALTPGGGERYILTLAKALTEHSKVTIVSPHPYSHLRLQSLGREFDLDLARCETTTYAEFLRGPRPALMFCLGNHIEPPVAAHGVQTWYHCQFPFPRDIKGAGSQNFLPGYHGIIVNSEYTRGHVLRALRTHELPSVPVEVIYPPVVAVRGNADLKKNIILNVGRFFVGGHSKRQDIMIEAFRKLSKVCKDLELHLAGSSIPEPAHIQYLNELQKRAEGLPVKFHVNPTKDTLSGLYRDAAMYWHGTGGGTDLEREPESAEHFGISIVEAMSAECVPLVLNAGGPREIITHGLDGFLYDTREQLVDWTAELLRTSDVARRIETGRAAGTAARRYTVERFVADIHRLVGLSPEMIPPSSRPRGDLAKQILR